MSNKPYTRYVSPATHSNIFEQWPFENVAEYLHGHGMLDSMERAYQLMGLGVYMPTPEKGPWKIGYKGWYRNNLPQTFRGTFPPVLGKKLNDEEIIILGEDILPTLNSAHQWQDYIKEAHDNYQINYAGEWLRTFLGQIPSYAYWLGTDKRMQLIGLEEALPKAFGGVPDILLSDKKKKHFQTLTAANIIREKRPKK